MADIDSTLLPQQVSHIAQLPLLGVISYDTYGGFAPPRMTGADPAPPKPPVILKKTHVSDYSTSNITTPSSSVTPISITATADTDTATATTTIAATATADKKEKKTKPIVTATAMSFKPTSILKKATKE